MYEMTREVYCSNIGCNGCVRNSSLVDLLQDCSLRHLETDPVLSPFFERENCLMFLTSRQLDIIRMPEYSEKLTIRTWCYELNRAYGLRNTVIYGEDGLPCVKCNTGGAFVNLETQRPVKITAELADAVDKSPKLDMEYMPRKIRIPDREADITENVAVLKCFIDMNGHVNNARYIDIADEYLEDDAKVGRIRIEYKVPLKRGDDVVAKVYHEENHLLVSLEDIHNRAYCICEYTLV